MVGRALGLGLLGSLFFAVTFVLNQSMHDGGGHWLWSSSLRFFFMAPVLALALVPQGRWRPVVAAIGAQPGPWFLWSTVGFGVFYLFVCLAASTGPGWLVAAGWQVTIVAGALLTPLVFGKPLPKRQAAVALVILAGVVLVEATGNRPEAGWGATAAGAGFILVAAFAYPLGNRKMMEHVPPGFGTLERVAGMTFCSLPFWGVAAGAGLALGIGPTPGQLVQAGAVALFSGVAGTLLFFGATDLVKDHPRQLALVESTQAGEVLFSLAGGIVFLGNPLPSPAAWAGIAVITAGIAANAAVTAASAPRR
jgi:drug/metabolite transporter (DMT)-like permease